ncbi:protein translocase subunit SecDF [Vicingus serpentipes]|uniref:Multifunctional fusion protein n=1 Tax=Vicingus serpentipes TaxID=1926625 RepID=A0A5C6RSS3_9FLAO|nr:protein translocase subunit SecDF [Vicingus serpentipes]TXB65391.1 protein translocase subunit SecDF [Vicingus serpentipes]
MQNKGLLTTFTVLFALAALYALSLTFVANGVESDAKDYANGDSDVEYAYLDSMSSEEVYPIIGYTYGELRTKTLNLGLDLKGGMNVTLEVQISEVVKALSSFSKDNAFNQAIIDAKTAQKATNADFVTLFGQVYQEKNPNGKLSSIFYTLDNKDKLSPNATNEEVLAFIKEEADDAIERSFNVLRTRISLFGAAQPNIQKLTGSDRILVELPGVKDKVRVRQLLQGTAKLEFWLTYENQEIYPMLAQADELLGAANKAKASVIDTTVTDEVLSEGTAEEVADAIETLVDSTVNSAEEGTASLLDKIEGAEGESSDSNAVATPEQSFEDYAKDHPLFAIMRPAIFQDEQGQYFPGQGPIVGYVAIKDTAKVNSYMAMKEVRALFPPRIKFLWTAKPYDDEGKFLQLLAIKVDNREGKAVLEGDVIIDASQQFDQFSGSPRIDMAMNGEGANKWKHITADNIGKSVVIALDNLVYSFPTVQGEISGGQSNITGNFDIEEAKLIANILKAGKLPAPARIIEENVVGPTLGQESINKGMLSFIVALLVVLAYMVFYYSKAGIASVIALLANMFFIFGVLASMPQLIALTLPGIAGIILTIGMSVDANVLIFERIREEIAAGKGTRLAVADGYKFAYSSIIDANVTTLLTGAVLWFFGTGPVEGFAKTLVIGIGTSLFTAIFITRLIFEFNLNKNKVLSFSTKLTDGAFKNTNINFLTNRKKFYILSGIIIVIGLGSLLTKGLQYGIDFKGGRTYVVRFDNPVSTVDISKSLESLFETSPETKTFGDDNQVKITTTFMIDSEDENADDVVEGKLNEGLASLSSKYEVMSSQKVGPTIADDIKTSSFWSILFSLIIIFIYIVFRFKKWQFGVGAIFALFHDVLITLAIFSIFYGILPFSLEVDQAFIAAILTVVGYSINDTVVVFDRIREYLGSFKKRDNEDVINEALNSTLSRTVNTSLSTIFVLLMIFVFGGEVIRGFSFALLIGVIVGTYSSLFIASPIMYDFTKKIDKK